MLYIVYCSIQQAILSVNIFPKCGTFSCFTGRLKFLKEVITNISSLGFPLKIEGIEVQEVFYGARIILI